MQAFKESY